MKSRDWGRLILLLFFGSGATALVYEVVWSKFLSQIFGSTIYAQTVVLATFMGGLALGNRLFGQWADRLKQPVRAYGYLEIAIGLYAFFFPALDQLADRIFVALGSSMAERTLLLLALKGVLSALLLLGPTILMGGSLPLLAAWLQKYSSDAGRRSALFYSINSLGAVVGAGVAGFWLIQSLGLVSTLQMTALVNILIGATAGLLSRSHLLDAAPAEAAAPVSDDVHISKTWRWACGVAAMSGGISMGLEVLASRSLAMIFGSSVQSFAVVLMAFIVGIGLGSAWIASARRRLFSDVKLVVLFLSIAAFWVVLLVLNIERWTELYRLAQTGLDRSTVGYFYHQFLTAGIALVIFGLPAACIGAVLPLMIRTESSGNATLGHKVGTLLTCNTLGAVVGTLSAGFVLMPLVGLRNAFGVMAAIAALTAVVVAWRYRWLSGCGLGLAAIAFACCLFIFGGDSWRYVMSAAVFRSREKEFDHNIMNLRKAHTKILFYEDSPDATVSVEQTVPVPGVPNSGDLCLRVNGKPDASARADLNTQLLLSDLPMLSKPGAKDVFIFGLGSGISLGALTSFPVEHITVAENCDPIIRAAQFFTNWNRNALADPRLHIWHEDARTVLKLSPQKYDAIIAEPSNPWTVGIGSVFSREFYQITAQRLKPGGIMAQWFHVYEMHDGIAELVVRTFCSVYPYVEVWDVSGGDMVLLGSFQPWPTGPDVFKRNFMLPGVQFDMQRLDINSPAALFSRRLASQGTAFAITGDGPMQSDLFPVLEYAAPEAFYLGDTSTILKNFDERTTQQLLAPPAKTALLRSIPGDEVRSVFKKYGSLNPDLQLLMRGTAIGDGVPVPCIFYSNAPCITIPPVLAGDSATTATFTRAATLLYGGDAQRHDALKLIESIVETPAAATSQPLAAWSSVAASLAYSFGDFNRAVYLATLALKQDPADPQASFLLRVASRMMSTQAGSPSK